jgi:hypothetical protein
MAKKRSEAEWRAEWLARRREVEGILARLDERIRVANEREARRRERLRRLTFGLLGRDEVAA